MGAPRRLHGVPKSTCSPGSSGACSWSGGGVSSKCFELTSPPLMTVTDITSVLLLLDVSMIARNVGSNLVFAASSRAASSHSDLGVCINTDTDNLPTLQTTRLLAGTRMLQSGLPRVFVITLAYMGMQTSGGRCSCTLSAHSTQSATAQHSPRVL